MPRVLRWKPAAFNVLLTCGLVTTTPCFFKAAIMSLGAKGVTFVELYGIYEFAITGAVAAALDSLKDAAVPANQIRPELLSLVLDPNIESCGNNKPRKRKWIRRIELFVAANNTSPVVVPSCFPDDGSHYREEQLRTIWRIFGLASPILPSMRLLPKIAELVENRNKIAHGRETSRNIGRNYSSREIRARIAAVQRICLYVVRELESHCASVANLCR